MPRSEANFVWLPLGQASERFGVACAEAGIRVRAYPNLGVRVSIGTRAVNDEVLRIAAGLGAG